MTYHYHGIDAEESILTKSLPNLGTWALPNLFFIINTRVTEVSLPKWSLGSPRYDVTISDHFNLSILFDSSFFVAAVSILPLSLLSARSLL